MNDKISMLEKKLIKKNIHIYLVNSFILKFIICFNLKLIKVIKNSF